MTTLTSHDGGLVVPANTVRVGDRIRLHNGVDTHWLPVSRVEGRDGRVRVSVDMSGLLGRAFGSVSEGVYGPEQPVVRLPRDDERNEP